MRPHTCHDGPGLFYHYGDLMMSADLNAMRADLEILAGEFQDLAKTDCRCAVWTAKTILPAKDRQAVTRLRAEMGYAWCLRLDMVAAFGNSEDAWDRIADGEGLKSAGFDYRDLASCAGWHDHNFQSIAGRDARQVRDATRRANQIVSEYASVFSRILWPSESLEVDKEPWASVVNLCAEKSNLTMIPKPLWCGFSDHVARFSGSENEIDRALMKLFSGPVFTYSVRASFIRDSSVALRWLIGQLSEIDDPGKVGHDDRDAIESAALNAVVSGGLAGVLQVAVGARAVDRVTAIIRERVEGDRRLYWYRADDWAAELKVSKPTVTDSDGWREIMQWRAANRADRVSKRVSKKTGK